MPQNFLHVLRADLAEEAAAKEFQIHVQAVRELDAGLSEALRYRDKLLVDSPNRDRYSAHRALHTVVCFLQAHDEWRDKSRPLVQLEVALRDLENGHVTAMLRPCGDAGGRPVSFYEATLRGYAAAIMDGLMQHAKMSQKQAADWVSGRLRKAGHEVAPGTVIDWRKKARNHSRNADLHRAYCAVIGNPGWSTPVPFAKQLVVKLIRLQPQKGG